MTAYNAESWKQIQIEQSRQSLLSTIAQQRSANLNQMLSDFFAQHEASKAQAQQN